MRYTRNRQMQKMDISVWKGEKNHPIESMRNKYLAHKLDSTFKWHSEAVSHNYWSNHVKSMFSFEVESNHKYSYDGVKRVYKITK